MIRCSIEFGPNKHNVVYRPMQRLTVTGVLCYGLYIGIMRYTGYTDGPGNWQLPNDTVVRRCKWLLYRRNNWRSGVVNVLSICRLSLGRLINFNFRQFARASQQSELTAVLQLGYFVHQFRGWVNQYLKLDKAKQNKKIYNVYIHMCTYNMCTYNIPVPAAVGGSPTGKCGLLPQHFHHRVNAVVVFLA